MNPYAVQNIVKWTTNNEFTQFKQNKTSNQPRYYEALTQISTPNSSETHDLTKWHNWRQSDMLQGYWAEARTDSTHCNIQFNRI